MAAWQLQEAKARFSEVVRQARRAPQTITWHGKAVAVILSKEAFDATTEPSEDLFTFMRKSPFVGADLKLVRDKRGARTVKL